VIFDIIYGESIHGYTILQCKNDRWVVECVFSGKQNGCFLEAGATNGIWVVID
jgi:hypothetical protein